MEQGEGIDRKGFGGFFKAFLFGQERENLWGDVAFSGLLEGRKKMAQFQKKFRACGFYKSKVEVPENWSVPRGSKV